MARLTGLSVQLFTIGGTEFKCALEDATLNIEVTSEDARGVCDEWSYAYATSKAWSIDANIFVSTVASIITDMISGDAIVTVVFNTGGNTYSGTGLLTSGSHSAGRTGLQKQSIKIMGQGELSVA